MRRKMVREEVMIWQEMMTDWNEEKLKILAVDCVVLCCAVWCGAVQCGIVWCAEGAVPNGNGLDGLAYG